MSGAAKDRLVQWTWLEINLTSKATIMAVDKLISKMQVVRESWRPEQLMSQ